MATKTAKATGIHRELMEAAEDLIVACTEQEDGKTYFNLFRFLERLESEAITIVGSRADSFAFNEHEIARYIWLCLATAEGPAYPEKFRGMTVCD